MEFQNLGIRHIEIHKKEDESDIEEEVHINQRNATEKSECSSDNSESENYNSDSELDDQVKATDMNLASILNAVNEINEQLSKKEEKLKSEGKKIFFREANFNLDTQVDHDEKRPKTGLDYSRSKQINNQNDLIRGSLKQTQLDRNRPISAPVRHSKYTMEKLSSPSLISVTPARNRPASHRPTRPVSASNRLNISFSNDEVRHIDLENQRLLKEIIKNKSKIDAAPKKKTPRPMSASAINRSRRQRDIERENLQFLKRLQSVKPTVGLARETLLKDHLKKEQMSDRISRVAKRPSSSNMQSRYSVN